MKFPAGVVVPSGVAEVEDQPRWSIPQTIDELLAMRHDFTIDEQMVADPDLAAIKQVHGLLMRESEVMTINALFHALGLVFMLALLLMPLVKKVSPGTGAAEAH